MKSIEEVREFFNNDRFATVCDNCTIEAIGENYAKCKLTIEDKQLNANNSLMGGAIFTLADFTFAVATNNQTNCAVTQNASISFLNTAKGNFVTCEARCIKDGRKVCVYELTVTDELGRIIATALFNGQKII